jgi:hypothetical protein
MKSGGKTPTLGAEVIRRQNVRLRLNTLLGEQVSNRFANGLCIPTHKSQESRPGTAQAEPQQIGVAELENLG